MVIVRFSLCMKPEMRVSLWPALAPYLLEEIDFGRRHEIQLGELYHRSGLPVP